MDFLVTLVTFCGKKSEKKLFLLLGHNTVYATWPRVVFVYFLALW